MPKKVVKKGPPRGGRLNKDIDAKLLSFCADHNLNIADVVAAAVTCFMTHPGCRARKSLIGVKP